MLKVADLITKYSSLILVVLGLPVVALFFSGNFQLKMIPGSRHVEYQITFEVPARTSSEIYMRVTQPAEKVLNGLPGLLSLSSETIDESASVKLSFHEGVGASSAYLNIQEKMDRIKLLLPRDVKASRVSKVDMPKAAQLKLNFSKETSIRSLRSVLAPFMAGVEKTEPSLQQTNRVVVTPDPQKLASLDVPLSQFVSALQSLGMETAIGRKDGVMFETGMAFQSLDELKRAPIAAKGHRPIRLSDVATAKIDSPKSTKSLKLWLDPSRTSILEVRQAMQTFDPEASVSWPFWREIKNQSAQPILLCAFVLLLQVLVIKGLKLPWKALPVFAVMGIGLVIHFLFWKGVLRPPITVLDLHALTLTLIVGSVFLAVLYARIRTYFEISDKFKRPRKSLGQAKLFSLAELIPTYIVLFVAFWLMALPVLSTGVNGPSREVAEGFFYIGMPLVLLTLVIAPLMTSAKFLRENVHSTGFFKFNFSLSPGLLQTAMWGIFAFIFSTFLLFDRIDFGISYDLPKEELAGQMLTSLRGYEQSLVYKFSDLPKNESLIPVADYRSKASKVLEFSPASLQHLGSLDLAGFTRALESLQGSDVFGFLQSESGPVPIEFSADLLKSDILGELLLAGQGEDVKHKPVRVLTESEFLAPAKARYRDNLFEGDRFYFEKGSHSGTFRPPEEGLKPTPWSAYFLKQFSEFKDLHVVSLIFLFFLFSIYLNSFIRSAMLMIFLLASSGFVYLVREVLPHPYHVDSLWLLYLGPFLALFQILVLTRVIDIERARGVERDESLEVLKSSFAPTVFLCSSVVVLGVLVAGLSEFVPGLPSLGLWKEGVFIAAVTGVILLASQQILFPLFYLISEEFVDRILYLGYRFLNRPKS